VSQPASVSYVFDEGDQAADGLDGFYPGLTPGQQATIDSSGLDGDSAVPLVSALPGPDTLALARSLPARLSDAGLHEPQLTSVQEAIERGGVAAIYRFPGDGREARQILRWHGARNVTEIRPGGHLENEGQIATDVLEVWS
jgi:hypothetical protein